MYNSMRDSLQKTPESVVQVNLKSKVSNAYTSGGGYINSSKVNINDKSMRSTVVESSLDPVFKWATSSRLRSGLIATTTTTTSTSHLLTSKFPSLKFKHFKYYSYTF